MNMSFMFYNCSAFNQSVANFNTAAVTNMALMFYNCSAFNQDISTFSAYSLTDATNMLTGSAFNETNYDLLLPAWQGLAHNPDVTFSAGSAKYGAGVPAVARAALVADGWTITDGGLSP
jgi:surface protein